MKQENLVDFFQESPLRETWLDLDRDKSPGRESGSGVKAGVILPEASLPGKPLSEIVIEDRR